MSSELRRCSWCQGPLPPWAWLVCSPRCAHAVIARSGRETVTAEPDERIERLEALEEDGNE